MVRGFLNYTKEHVPSVEPVDLNRMAEEVTALYQEKAATDGIDLILVQGRDMKVANVDPKDIHTCLVNLVSNAIDACNEKDPGNGKLQVKIQTAEKDGVIILEVVDTGAGMDEKTLHKVFSTFFTTKGLEGNGLGLLVTGKLVHAHGGDVSVESTPGEGSTFRIALPRWKLPADPNA